MPPSKRIGMGQEVEDAKVEGDGGHEGKTVQIPHGGGHSHCCAIQICPLGYDGRLERETALENIDAEQRVLYIDVQLSRRPVHGRRLILVVEVCDESQAVLVWCMADSADSG